MRASKILTFEYVELDETFTEHELVYNPIMAQLDDKSKQVSNPSGNNVVNAWNIEEIYGDRIRISMLYYVKVSDDHVDEYSVVNQTTSTKDDARKYANLIINVLDGNA